MVLQKFVNRASVLTKGLNAPDQTTMETYKSIWDAYISDVEISLGGEGLMYRVLKRDKTIVDFDIRKISMRWFVPLRLNR